MYDHKTPRLIGFVLPFRVPLDGCAPDAESGVPPALPLRRVVRQFGNRLTQARLRPQARGDEVRVDTEPAPPCGFITAAVNLPMVSAAERHRKLLAHFAIERPRLRQPKIMRI